MNYFASRNCLITALHAASFVCLGVMIVVPQSAIAQVQNCGVPTTLKGQGDTILRGRKFSDGSIAVRAPLAVNPDGGLRSYTPGDHGFTYIANGLSRWVNKERIKCDTQCRIAFLEAEKKGFGPGTAEFCVFAMVVEPIDKNQLVQKCDRGVIVGNGKGRIALATQEVGTITGESKPVYLSTTSVTHLVNGKEVYLDSESLAIAVTHDKSSLGSLVWIGGGAAKFPQIALIGDIGPAFGEGSVALHQLLRTGAIRAQAIGPIPLAQRCTEIETTLLLQPFTSRPDMGSEDGCRPGYKPRQSSDIRAYGGFSKQLDFVILGNTNMRPEKNPIATELNSNAMKKRAQDAGHTEASIEVMRRCLDQP
jgi:hypothetical protein